MRNVRPARLRSGVRRVISAASRRATTASVLVAVVVQAMLGQQVVVPKNPTAAQGVAAGLGKNASNTDIANAIKNSGLSQAEVRAKLQQAGFDPSLADPFFAPGGATPTPAPSSSISALTSIGLLGPASTQTGALLQAQAQKLDSMQTDTTPETPTTGLQIFGRDIFSSKTSAFEPELSGPVDPNYRLGVGDAVQVVLTGQVEQAYQTEVRPDGKILLPSIGFTSVAGLTLDAARIALRASGAKVYSGIRTGGTRLDLTVTQVRTNQVFVIGDVVHPGSYMVNGLSTAFHAIARAGGPSDNGSFRDIELRRGGRVVKRIDLYDYLIRGDASVDVSTEQGDVLFVPPARSIVQIAGAVRRPAIFELRDAEKFKDLLFYAGGLLPSAANNRIQIDRILPPELRRAGVDRVSLDVPIGQHPQALDTLTLLGGDSLTVFQIGDLRRNTVKLSGEVFQPGTYQWNPGLKLAELIARANGTLPWAVTDRVKITRNVLSSGHVQMMNVSLADSAGARTPLEEFDEVLVLDRRKETPIDSVTITGGVHKQGTTPWAEHLTLGDLIDLSDGFETWAKRDEVVVIRNDNATGKPSIAKVDMRENGAYRFELLPGDQVAVLDLRVANPAMKVNISGAVFQPGDQTYGPGATLGAAITLSGGLREDAQFIDVARRVRATTYSDSAAVVMRFAITRSAGDSSWRAFPLEADDNIAVRSSPGSKHPGSVTLTGAFLYPGSYTITGDKERVSELLKRAGGLAPNAYESSFRMVRNGRPVPVELARIRRGIVTDDIRLADGDQIQVDAISEIVSVGGAVERPASVPYRSDWNLDDYINAAGGFQASANTKNIVVTYSNGSSKRKGNGWLGIGGGSPKIEPGSTVSVETLAPSDQAEFGKTLTTIMQVTTTLVSLIVAFVAIKKS
jgi:polysaccharide export outer membrane protein